MVALCRMVYRKGIDLLAAILPGLAHAHPELRFIVGACCRAAVDREKGEGGRGPWSAAKQA